MNSNRSAILAAFQTIPSVGKAVAEDDEHDPKLLKWWNWKD